MPSRALNLKGKGPERNKEKCSTFMGVSSPVDSSQCLECIRAAVRGPMHKYRHLHGWLPERELPGWISVWNAEPEGCIPFGETLRATFQQWAWPKTKEDLEHQGFNQSSKASGETTQVEKALTSRRDPSNVWKTSGMDNEDKQ